MRMCKICGSEVERGQGNGELYYHMNTLPMLRTIARETEELIPKPRRNMRPEPIERISVKRR